MAGKNFNLVQGNLFELKSDVIVIPHTVQGSIPKVFNDNLAGGGILFNDIPRNAKVGDVHIIPVINRGRQHIAFACLSDNGIVNYTTVREIIKKLLNNKTVANAIISCPLLGTDEGKLIEFNVYSIIKKSCEEDITSNNTITLVHGGDNFLIEAYNSRLISTYNSRQLAFVCNISLCQTNSWFLELIKTREYYYEAAQQKFHMFNNFRKPNENFFYDLLESFNKHTGTFQAFIDKQNPFSEEYKFLILCGELIAHIDRNGYNKNTWNKTIDGRTLAKSNVRQDDWVHHLIRFKTFGTFTFDTIPNNIANALIYLSSPRRDIPMLSNSHRAQVMEHIFNMDYEKPSDLSILLNLFQEESIIPNHSDNLGVLCCRFLYLPEIKSLWNLATTRKKIKKTSGEPLAENEAVEEESVVLDYSGEQPLGSIEAIIHSDYYAKIDLLDYELYAKCIAKFITHRNTEPPLTIGIMAPWGRGKTSLMHFIIAKLNNERSSDAPNKIKQVDNTPTSKIEKLTATYGEFSKWLNDLNSIEKLVRYVKRIPNRLTKKKIAEAINPKKLEYPTVWFNAWKFQKSEEIWAALAYEIINQLLEQLKSPLDKEKFWLQLNLRRIDREAIRHKIRMRMFKFLIPALLTFLFTSAFMFLKSAMWFFTSAPLALLYIYNRHKQFQAKILNTDLSKYIKQPDYKSKMGYLYSVEEDLKEVLNILVEKNKPAVIFIDDLDRCSPTTVTQVVESINLFISGDIPQCYFILGHDAQMVAAALDVQYREIGENIANLEKTQGSIGWYFMEKFIQLQFNIPTINKEQSSRFISQLFKGKQDLATEAKSEEMIKKAEDIIRSSTDPAEILGKSVQDALLEAENISIAKKMELTEKIIDKTSEIFNEDDERETDELIEELKDFLSDSPRVIKRFVNLYRFYRFIQLSQPGSKMREIESLQLGKWILVMMRWPQLIRAIQWGTEINVLKGSSSMGRVSELQSVINKKHSFTTWNKHFATAQWLCDKELFDFLHLGTNEIELQKAVEFGIW